MRDERNPARNDTTVRILILWLALSLLLRAPRVLADDEVDYSHEWYREDNNRMSIDTDSVLGNFDINKYLSVSGHFVEDAITGATPTGAPPQAEWPFPTYAYYYDRAFSQAFTAAIDNPNNLILYQSGVFTSYQAYTNYVAHTTPQLKTEAASAAGASYYSLTNNSNFHNTTVPLTHLHDHRTAFSMDLPITLGPNTFTPEVSQSKEDDYHSYGCALNDSLLLNQKNTTLNAGWSFDNDRVRDDTLIHWPKKISHDFLVGVNQVIDPVSYVTFDFTYASEHGYLNDPYQGVMFAENFLQTNPSDAGLTPERRPAHRDSETFYAGYTRFIRPLNGSVDAGYRFFHDTSEIFGQTMQLAWHQKIGRHWVISPEFRYYYQTAANYYYVLVPNFDSPPAYYSSDYRLSQMQTIDGGLSVMCRIAKFVAVDLRYDRYVMQGLDGSTSQSAYPSANIISAGVRIYF